MKISIRNLIIIEIIFFIKIKKYKNKVIKINKLKDFLKKCILGISQCLIQI